MIPSREGGSHETGKSANAGEAHRSNVAPFRLYPGVCVLGILVHGDNHFIVRGRQALGERRSRWCGTGR